MAPLPSSRVPAAAVQQRLPLGSPLENEEDPPITAAPPVALGYLSAGVGPYASTPSLACPERNMRSGQEWLPLQAGGKSWTKDPKANLFLDTFNGGSEHQRGLFVVLRHVCTLEGTTSMYLFRGGKSSNAWQHFDLVAGSRLSNGVQRSRHGAVSSYRKDGKDATKVHGGAAEGPMSQYLTASRIRAMGPAQARPRHIRFVLMLAMTPSRFSLSENSYLQDLVRGLGVPYAANSTAGVRDIPLDLFQFLSTSLRSEVRQLQLRCEGLPFFRLVRDLWTERHGSGSYGSLVLRWVNPDGFTIRELHLGITLFCGRRDHDNIKRWVLHQLARFGVKQQEISSSTTESGSNVKKALRQVCPRWIPCAAHAVHLAVKASLGATRTSSASRDARQGDTLSSRSGSKNFAASELLGRTRKPTAQFHKSPTSVAMLNAGPMPGDQGPLKLLTESPARWGCTYASLVQQFTLMTRLVVCKKLL